MPEPSQCNSDGRKPERPRRRWLQFGLRTLLLLTTAAAALAMAWRVYVEPFRRQRQTMALIEQLGGSYRTSAAPAWLRQLFGQDFHNLALVKLADCGDPSAYLNQVAALPALEILVVGGSAFSDEHLRRLHGLQTLRGLVLDTTSVTQEGLATFQAALPSVDIYQSQRLAIEALRNGSEVVVIANPPPARLQAFLEDESCEAAQHVSLGDNTRDADFALLRNLSGLVTLDLDGTRITDAWVERRVSTQ